MKINTGSMLYGTIILSISNIIVRLLGFAFRVFLSRAIGPQGMGLVQLVNPVFHIAVTLTVAGIPVAVSRLISEKNVKRDFKGMRLTMTVSLALVTAVSIIINLVALLNLDFISKEIIKEERTKGALSLLFPSVIFIGLGAVLKGFFYGQKNIHPPALAEIIEQLTRMAVSIGLILWFVPNDNYALAAMLVMLGTVFGEIFNTLFLHVRYSRCKKDLHFQYFYSNKSLSNQTKRAPLANQSIGKKTFETDSAKKILASIAAIALPITASRLVNSLMSSANSILIPQRLMVSGLLREDAVSLFGIVSGMVMPLMFLPFTITNALTVVIIPNLSESLAMKRWNDIENKISKAIHLTCIIALASTALLASLGRTIGDLLYQQPLVGTLLVPLSFSLLSHALQHTCGAILNGLGKQNRAAIHFMTGSAVQLFCTYFLLADPAVRIWGFVIGFSLSTLIVGTANIITVLKTAKMRFRLKEWILKPGFSALLMGFSAGITFRVSAGIGTPILLSLIISAVIGFSFFIISLWAVNGMPAPADIRNHI